MIMNKTHSNALKDEAAKAFKTAAGALDDARLAMEKYVAKLESDLVDLTPVPATSTPPDAPGGPGELVTPEPVVGPPRPATKLAPGAQVDQEANKQAQPAEAKK
jgi:hypothetical protein